MPGLSTAAPMMAGPNEGIPMLGAQPGGRPMGLSYDIRSVMPKIGQTLLFGRNKFGLGGSSQPDNAGIPVEEDDEDQQQTMGYAEGGPVEEEEDTEAPVAAPVEQAIPEEVEATPEEEQIEQPVGPRPVPRMKQYGEEAGSTEDGVMEYLKGGDAAPAQTVAAMEHATGVEDPIRAKYAALAEAYDQGGPEQAWRLMQSYRQQDMLQRTLAATKLQKGDVAGAADAATQAMQNVLDGQDVKFIPTPDGSGLMVVANDMTGEGDEARGVVPIKKFFDWLTGPSGQHDALLNPGAIKQTLLDTANRLGQHMKERWDATAPVQVGAPPPAVGGDVQRDAAIEQASQPNFAQRAGRAISGMFDSFKSQPQRPGIGGEAARNAQQGIPEYVPPNEDWKKPGYVSPYDQHLYQRDVATREELKRRQEEQRARRSEAIERQNQARMTPEERLFGRDIVAAANRLFPYRRQEKQRATFLAKQLELRNKETVADTNNQGKIGVAERNSQGRLEVARQRDESAERRNQLTVSGRQSTADTRARSQVEVQRMRGESSERTHTNSDIARIATGLIANNPRLAKDPAALADAIEQYTERRGQSAPAQQRQAPQQQAPQQSAPQGEIRMDRKTGKLWTMQNGRLVEVQR